MQKTTECPYCPRNKRSTIAKARVSEYGTLVTCEHAAPDAYSIGDALYVAFAPREKPKLR